MREPWLTSRGRCRLSARVAGAWGHRATAMFTTPSSDMTKGMTACTSAMPSSFRRASRDILRKETIAATHRIAATASHTTICLKS